MKRFVSSLVGWQVILCLLGVCLSFAPTVNWTNAFWGEMGSWASIRPGVSLHTVTPKSPADQAGLKVHDEILTLNGNAINSGTELQDFWRSLRRGEEFSLRINRDGQESTLRATGVPAQVAVVGYWDWQLVAGFVLLGLAALLIATQPVKSRSLIWRPVLVAVVAFSLAVVIPLAPWDWRLVWQQWSSWTLDSGFSFRKGALIATAVCLVFLAAYEIQTLLRLKMDALKPNVAAP